MQTDYYKILGLTPSATPEQIRQAYRTKAKLYHPDINNNPNAKVLFQLINEAYQVLVNPDKKRWYDFKLKYPTTTAIKQRLIKKLTKKLTRKSDRTERLKSKNIVIENVMHNDITGDRHSADPRRYL